MIITRTSSLRVRSIFLKFSAWREIFLSFLRLEIFVKPCTIFATSVPILRSISSIENFVSSTTSCNNAAHIEVASKPICSATILATLIG